MSSSKLRARITGLLRAPTLKTRRENMKRPETVVAQPRVAGYLIKSFLVQINMDSQRFPNVTQPADNIFNQERYMTICSYNSEGTRQNCPNEDTYPWLETEKVNPCGGNIPCKDAENC